MTDERDWCEKCKVLTELCNCVGGSVSAGMAGSIASPWPAKDVVRKLIEAAKILLDDKDYDGHGYEEICAARDEAAKWILER